VALNTNKPRITTDRVLAELDFTNFFHATVCADDLSHKKPHPEPLFHLARQLAVHPTELVMIGDGPQDVYCGKAAGARTVGVTYGIKSAAEVGASHPDFLIDTIAEVLTLFPWREE
jgi:phosphoglycolate phosphatase-like HAD superfamily hydrolase